MKTVLYSFYTKPKDWFFGGDNKKCQYMAKIQTKAVISVSPCPVLRCTYQLIIIGTSGKNTSKCWPWPTIKRDIFVHIL